jgi:hypothetical protein
VIEILKKFMKIGKLQLMKSINFCTRQPKCLRSKKIIIENET